jgi:hypothetical protein
VSYCGARCAETLTEEGSLMHKWQMALVGGASLLVLLACGESANVGTTVASGGTSSGASTTATSKVQAHFKVGDVVKIGDWQVTVNGIKSSPGADYDTPKAGNVYIIVDATYQNISAKAQTLSTGLQVELKDSTGQKYSETFVSAVASSPPDGNVNAGDKARGQVVWEVPTTMKQFNFSFQSDAFSSGASVWDIALS